MPATGQPPTSWPACVEWGALDQAVQVLRGPANAGVEFAAVWLAALLARQGDADQAQILRGYADAGIAGAAARLADMLAGQGDLEELRARANAGDSSAAKKLPELLARQGREEDAERVRRFGLNLDGSIASG